MRTAPENAPRCHGYAVLICLASLVVLSVVLLHSQTDVWQHISGYMSERRASLLYQPSFAGQNRTRSQDSKIHVHALNKKNNNAGIQQIQMASKFVDGMRHSFELVQGVSSRLYVYSALLDVHQVRLEVIMEQGYKFSRLLCVLYYTVYQSKPGLYVKPIIKELHTYKSPYTGAVVKCPVRSEVNKGDVPLFVGLVENERDLPKQTFYVENLIPKTGIRHEFTVCVPALFHMKSASLLIQKIEMVRFFGAGRIVFYNHSISTGVDAVLRMYAQEWKEGKERLEFVILPWKLPEENGKPIKIPYYAQQLAIDECHHRFKLLSTYMVFNDLDEYMVPLKHANWSELLAERRRLKPEARVWLFRSSVVNKDRPSPAEGFEQDYIRYGSSILGLTSRDQYVFPVSHRAKTMIDPTAVEEKAVHRVWDNKGITDNLPVDLGLMFHYRVPLNKCSPQVKETRVVDRYGKRLVARFKEVWAKLPGVELGWSPFKAADHKNCEDS